MLLAALLTGATGAEAERLGAKGRSEVRELVISWTPGEAEVKIVAHLATGMAVEDKMKDPDSIDRLLRLSEAFAMPRARLQVDLDGDAITSFHLATGEGRGR
jgi:hypothetical protein